MSKKAIALLSKKHENYSINTEAGGADKDGNFLVKAFIQIFDPKYEPGKQPTVTKTVNSYGIGKSVKEAQEDAIEAAVANLGL